jgi:hypothetical protein
MPFDSYFSSHPPRRKSTPEEKQNWDAFRRKTPEEQKKIITALKARMKAREKLSPAEYRMVRRWHIRAVRWNSRANRIALAQEQRAEANSPVHVFGGLNTKKK